MFIYPRALLLQFAQEMQLQFNFMVRDFLIIHARCNVPGVHENRLMCVTTTTVKQFNTTEPNCFLRMRPTGCDSNWLLKFFFCRKTLKLLMENKC